MIYIYIYISVVPVPVCYYSSSFSSRTIIYYYCSSISSSTITFYIIVPVSVLELDILIFSSSYFDKTPLKCSWSAADVGSW